MKKTSLIVCLLLIASIFCGCEALSLSENIEPYFAGTQYKEGEQYYKDYYYPLSEFKDAPSNIFLPTGYGGEYIDRPLILRGTIKSTERINGFKYYILETSQGTIYISNNLFTLDKLEDEKKVEMYFVYSGYNNDLGYITGAYVDYKND